MKLNKEIGLGKSEKIRKKINVTYRAWKKRGESESRKAEERRKEVKSLWSESRRVGESGPRQLSINIPAVERALHPSPLLLFVRLLEDRSSTLASLHSGSSTLPPPPLSLYRFDYRRWLEEEEPRGEEGKEVGV